MATRSAAAASWRELMMLGSVGAERGVGKPPITGARDWAPAGGRWQYWSNATKGRQRRPCAYSYCSRSKTH